MLNLRQELWAGTEASYLQAQSIEEQQASHLQALVGQDEAPKSRLLSYHGDTAVVTIKGPLANVGGSFAEFFGMTSYGEIRSAMVEAAQNPEAARIVLDISSGGGAVNGVSDTARLIGMVNDKIKPVITYADGIMASAAYWLGVGASKAYASDTALVGSIGVITKHYDQSKLLENEGIKATVLRAGKYKALGQPEEPLSAAARDQIQESLDAVYSVFTNWVAERRGVSAQIVEKQMAQGREFTGQAAVDAGLVDGITSFDALIASFQKKKVDKAMKITKNSTYIAKQDTTMPKATLSAEQLAALEAGVELEVEAGEAEAAAESIEAAGEVTEVAEAAADESTETKAEVKADTGLVDYLKSQVREKDAELREAALKLRELESAVASMTDTHSGLTEVVAKSVSTMRVALGGHAVNAAEMTADALLAEHHRLSTEFKAKFKIGGVAAASAEADAAEGKVQLDREQKARLGAVKLKPAK